MGYSMSRSEGEVKERSDAIDMQLQKDAQQFRRECPGDSGKSTVVKQMRINHDNGFSDSELAMYAPIVYRNLVDSAQAIIIMMRKLTLDCETPSNRALADKIANYELDKSNASVLSPEIAEAIHHFWQDPVVAKIMDEHGSEFYLMDSAFYFFSEVLRIGSPQYIPSETDVLKARQRTTAISETRFTMGQLSIHMLDVGGQRSGHRKWIHCFESVTSIIFCAALSEYDQADFEVVGTSRMSETLILFESIVNARWFLRTSIILFLNKIDVFKQKLPKVPLERYFPEYTGGNDVNKATKFILWRFMQANRARLSVFPHLTQATDTSNTRLVFGLVFSAVKETILQNALKDANIIKTQVL
ncbi:guanine nucleotide-binding protein subunit alpha [Marasmius oreades]|uniref:Guanine nucleotide-binding protein subunit alpha n=1 Tax=Marasmius oreades TaxID=181124 RepID=A0A9P8AFU9_9AGAR|nr:guanine nucleotide-binding protein subunit alpha [Marasmius oreades]KAG7100077.1 guanine nucleotide-binding protein subunit alpha [Marasmius oreades]